MSFRDNIEAFLAHTDHVRNLLARGEDGYQQEFMALKTQSQRYKTDKTYPTKNGEHELNIRKNRYKDILPFDHTRIKLTEIEGALGSDYINASYVKGYSGKNTYAAAQGPLPQTVMDFWRMIWETKAHIVVMSCNEYEMGKHKCERYWVDEGETKEFNDIVVSMISQRRVNSDFLIRTLKVKKEGEEERVINQFHYTAWPDHGVPNSVLPIIEMIKLIRDYQPHDDIPLVVHCSAGCGRTGTICVIDFVFNQLKQEAITSDFNLFDLVRDLRQQRPAMVQTRDQYELVHRAVAAMFNKQLEEKFPDYTRVYENVHLKSQVDKPRMPPVAVVKGSPGQQRKRNSHNYVNASPGQIDGDKVRVPSIPGKFRHSADSATLDAPIYANIQDEIEAESTEDVETQNDGFSSKHRRSFKNSIDVFSKLENDFGVPNEGLPSSPTSRSPPSPIKPVPPLKPTISIKPSSGAGNGGKPSPPLKPNTTPLKPNMDRPVPKQRKNIPHTTTPDVKVDRSSSPQPIHAKSKATIENALANGGQRPVHASHSPPSRNINASHSPPSRNIDTRRKSGPPAEEAPSHVHAVTKEAVQRSISAGLNEHTDNKVSNQKRTNNPQIPPFDKKFAQLNEALAAGKKPGEMSIRRSEKSKSMKRPPFSPPKPPPGAVPPKPPPASAKPGRERRSHSHEYEAVSLLAEPPKKDKDAGKEDSSKNDGASRLPFQVTPIQRTNLRQFGDDENSQDPSKFYAQSMRRKPTGAAQNSDLKGPTNDLDMRGPKTLPRQNTGEYAYAQEKFGRVEQRLKTEQEAKSRLVTAKAPSFVGAYSEVELKSPGGGDDKVKTEFKFNVDAKDPPAKPMRSKLPSVETSSAYEFVAPAAFVGGSGKDGGKSLFEQDNERDDVFSRSMEDEGMYGQYNDVKYLEDDTDMGTYGIYNDVEYKDGNQKRSKTPPTEAPRNAEARQDSNVTSTSSGWSFTDDEFDEDGPPALPERTQASYELVEMLDGSEPPKDQETSSTGNKLKELYQKKKDNLHKKTEGLKAGTKGLLNKLGDAVKKDFSSSSSSPSSTIPPSGPPPRPPPQINQAEIIERTLRNLDKQPDQPIMYNNHDISFPKRVPKPKQPRPPPQAWPDRQLSSVQL